MDLRRFIINLISNGLSALSGIGLSFFLTPYIVETLGKEGYGFYPLSSNFVMYAGILTTALNSMSSRFITISLEKKDIKQVNTYFNSVLFGNLLVSLFFLVVGGLFIFFADAILDIPIGLKLDVKFLFAFVFLGLIINVSSSVFSVSAFALNRFDRLAMINIGVNIIRLLTIIILFYIFTPRLYFLGLASVFSALYFLFASYRVTKKLLPEVHFSLNDFSWNALSILVGAGVWNSILALSNVINTQVDLILANRFFGASEMGLLSLTKIVPTALQMLLGIVVPLFLPDLLKAYANGEISKMKTNLDFSFKAIFIIVLFPVAIFFVYGEDFFKLWLPNEDSTQLYRLSIITLTPLLIHGTIETIHHVFVITNKLKAASFWGIFISLTSFILVILLCRYSNLGIYAIPMAGLLTGTISHLTFTPLYAAKCLDENAVYFYKRILKGTFSFLLLFALAFIWKEAKLVITTTWLGLFSNLFILGSVLFIICLFLMFDIAVLHRFYLKTIKKIKI